MKPPQENSHIAPAKCVPKTSSLKQAGWFKKLFKKIKKFFQRIAQAVVKFLQKVVRAVTKFFTGVFGPKVGGFLASIVNAPFNFLLNSFHYIAQGDFKGLIKYWGKVAVQVFLMVFVAIIAPYLLGVLFSFLGAALGFIGSFLGAVGGFLANTIPLLGQVIGGVLQFAGKFLVQAGQFLSRVGDKLLTQSKQLFQNLKDQGLKGFFNNLKDRILEKLNPLPAKIGTSSSSLERIPAHPWIQNYGLSFVARESSKIVQKSLLERITDYVQKFSLQFLQQKIDQKLEKSKMNSFVKSLLSSFTGAALGAVTSAALGAVSGGLGSLLSSAGGALAKAVGFLTQGITTGAKLLYQGGKAILSTIGRGLSALGRGIGNAFNATKSFFSNLGQKIHGTRAPPINAPSYDGRTLRDPFGNARITFGEGALPGEKIGWTYNGTGDPHELIRGPQNSPYSLEKLPSDNSYRADTGGGNFTYLKQDPKDPKSFKAEEVRNLTAEELLEHPRVRRALGVAIRRSVADPQNIHEEGGFILQDPKNRKILIRNLPAGTQDRLSFPLHPNGEIEGRRIIGSFHTHPNYGIDPLTGDEWSPRPSRRDRINTRNFPETFGPVQYVVAWKDKIYAIDNKGRYREVGKTEDLL